VGVFTELRGPDLSQLRHGDPSASALPVSLSSILGLTVLALFLVWPTFAQTDPLKLSCESPARVQEPVRFGLSNLDPKMDPCVDFYQYACGGWIEANPIPNGEVYSDTTGVLQRWNESILYEVLEKARVDNPSRSPVERELGDYFAACMDEKQIEADGLKPIQPELDRIAAISDKHAFAIELGRLHRMLFRLANRISTSIYAAGSGEPLFEVSSIPDFTNTWRTLAIVDQGGLGLPDRGYYFRNDKNSAQLRKEYVDHIRRTLELSGFNTAAGDAVRVLNIENELARVSADPLSRRHFRTLDHRFSLQQLSDLMPAFSWEDYLNAISAPSSPEYIVTSPDFFRGVGRLLATVTLNDWKLYLRWHLLKDSAPMLNRALAEEHFAFYGKTLEGQQEQSPRRQHCLQAIDRDLGDALGRAFVQRTFSEEDRKKALEIFAGLKVAMAEDIASLSWMSATTKQVALNKLRALEIDVGYPEKWRDYSSVLIDRKGWAPDAFRGSEFEHQRRVQRIGKPTDRADWYITTLTPDAYNSVQQNRVLVPAGFLGPPFFDPNIDDAVNFGGVGAGIGHELAHTFDDHGREYDPKGNLRDWWTQHDSQMFNERAECVSKQYSGYTAVDDIKINGELTLGENLADAVGLRIAYQALEETLATKKGESAKIDGLSPEQRFFLSYALQWCGSTRPEVLRELASNNPHSPPKYRVNGVLSDTPEFWRASGCKNGQPMVRDNACRVW